MTDNAEKEKSFSRVNRRKIFLRQLLGGTIQIFTGTTPEGYLFLVVTLLFMVMYWIAGYSNPFAIMAAILFSLFFVSGMVGYFSMLKLSVGRRFPAGIHVGETVEVALRIRNRKRFLPSGALFLAEKCGAFSKDGNALFLYAGPGETVEAWYKVIPRRRGVFTFNDTVIISAFPLGLFRNKGIARIPGKIVVYPHIGTIDRIFFQETEELMQRARRANMCREEEDFRGLREYRPGDSLRSVHWKSSARRGELLVREFERNEDRVVSVILDCWVDGDDLKQSAWERAISFAATLGRDAVRLDFRLNLLAVKDGESVRVSVDANRGNTAELYEVLARLQPADEPVVERLLEMLPYGGRAEAAVFIIGPARSSASKAEHDAGNIRRLDPKSEKFREIFRRSGEIEEP